MSNPLTIEARGELEIVITRAFGAPRRLVFDAWTKPELIQQWLGVRGGWTMPVCEVDLRVGGSYRFEWEKGDQRMVMTGEFVELDPPGRMVTTERFEDPWYPGVGLNTYVLEERADATTCMITTRYETKEIRDGVLASPMETGLQESYARLDENLVEIMSHES